MEVFLPNHAHDEDDYQRRMERLDNLLAGFGKESDRGLSILAAALLDQKLGEILSNF